MDEEEIREQLCATDKELFDLVFTSKQRLTDHVLHDLVQDRGIFCSAALSREELADYISTLPHDANDLSSLIERREPAERGEKSTFIELPTAATAADIKDVIGQLSKSGNVAEKITVPVYGKTTLTAVFEYDDFDYSKTRLAQRQRRVAEITIEVDNGKATMQLPANEKSRSLAEVIRQGLEEKTKQTIVVEELTLAGLATPELRTEFFTRLIASTDDYKFLTVTSLKVASFRDSATNPDLDEDLEDVAQDLIGIVTKVTLAGDNLMLTEEYKRLKQDGFFLVAVVWRAQEVAEPKELVQMNVSFDSPVDGTGIRYLVRSARSTEKASVPAFRRMSPIREKNLLALLEERARAIVAELLSHVTDKEAK